MCSSFLFYFPGAKYFRDLAGKYDVREIKYPSYFMLKKTAQCMASFDNPSQHTFNLACSDMIVKDQSVVLMMAVGKCTMINH